MNDASSENSAQPVPSSSAAPATGPIYMDHQATTPVDPSALAQMLPWFSQQFGNAASKSHRYGWDADEAVRAARQEVAALIGAQAKEIVFTSGATEANNLALLGRAAKAGSGHVVTVKTEHQAVLDPCRALQQQGFEVTFLEPEKDGLVHGDEVEAALRDDTFLVSVMAGNNEIGVVQPLADIGARCRARSVHFHTDATQAMPFLEIDVERDAIDLLSLSAHKMYGPKGVGALFVRRKPRVPLESVIHGGGHERGLRSGTLNVPGIVGLGAAAARARRERARDSAFVAQLRDQLLAGLRARVPNLVLHGHEEKRLPGNLSLGFPGVEAEQLLLRVHKVVALSTGSACTSATLEPSHVLRAIGVAHDLAHATVRFGLGKDNTEDEVAAVVTAIADAADALR